MPQIRNYFLIAACVRGGYCAFMGNSIINMNTIKRAVISFFAISTMLTFHKHTPFHKLGISACEYKSEGITAGVNTVKKSCQTLECSTPFLIIQQNSRNFNKIFNL